MFIDKRLLRREAGARYRKWSLDRTIPRTGPDAIVPLDRTSDVLLLCSRFVEDFDSQIYLAELAFAHEVAARNRVFAIADDLSVLFEKSVVWFLPSRFVSPRLWDYSRQVYEFATGLERQGNRLLCSSDEVLYWENKAYMHRRLAESGMPTPKTLILTAESWHAAKFDIEPVLIKEEHSAGSFGIHHFGRTTEARAFVQNYAFRPTESLLMQEIVPGATRDLRLTVVGDTIIRSASFWRIKSAEALAGSQWTTTATKYGSRVDHCNIPESAVRLAVKCLRELGIRMAGIDMIWIDDDVSRTPLILEISPYFQPNPPKPARYEHWSYKQYKQKPFIKDGYFSQQYMVFREIAGQVLDQGLF